MPWKVVADADHLEAVCFEPVGPISLKGSRQERLEALLQANEAVATLTITGCRQPGLGLLSAPITLYNAVHTD